MTLESPTTSPNRSQQEIFNFLTKVENYDQLMPESKQKFEVLTPESFLFALKGMPDIKLKVQEIQEPNLVVLGSASDKFPFTLSIHITEIAAQKSEVKLVFNGNFNAMMSMMVKNPLQNFINALSENIGRL